MKRREIGLFSLLPVGLGVLVRPAKAQFITPNQVNLPATPEGYGIIIDRTGSVDATSALNTFFQKMITRGDAGYLGAGIFKTSGEVLISGAGPNFGGLSGAGGRCLIQPASGHSYHGFRANITGEFLRKSPISGITIQGQGAIPGDGKAGFVLDATTLLAAKDIEVSGFDIGFDFINNCYNSSLWSPSVPRFASCNCGINIRAGADSGSDLSIYDSQLHAQLMAVNIIGNGGNYHFFGGQWSAQDGTFVAIDDARGVLTVGKTYNAAGTGSIVGGTYGIDLNGIAFEGWKGIWAIRSYDELSINLSSGSFVASWPTAGQLAIGIMKMSDPKNSAMCITGANRLGAGFYSQPSTALGVGAGTFSDGFTFDEGPWSIAYGQVTANGVLGPVVTFQGFGRQISADTRGFSRWAEVGAIAYTSMGFGIFRADFDGPLQKSNDDGSTWTVVG